MGFLSIPLIIPQKGCFVLLFFKVFRAFLHFFIPQYFPVNYQHHNVEIMENRSLTGVWEFLL